MCETYKEYPPWNFSWIVENKLAAMACPENVQNLNFLIEQGIEHLVTLSPEETPPIKNFDRIQWTMIPVGDLEAPTQRDIKKFIDICEKYNNENKAVGVHCRMGRGRTGVMAACYLVRFQNLAPERAIINLRLQRPGSVETPEQERAVLRYFDSFRGTQLNRIQTSRR